mmetsp:Transcript_17570/g.22553  ORF Transcript_17570/g.22553 Transcript_17570/m.22553 type:complete len:1118 (+) Transcript_17570:184-3537(+)
MADPMLHVPKETFRKFGIDLEELAQISPRDKKDFIQSKMNELYSQLRDVRKSSEPNANGVVDNCDLKEDDGSKARKPGRLLIVTRRLPVKLEYGAEDKAWKTDFLDTDSLNHQMQNTKLFHDSGDSIWMGWVGQPVEPGQHQLLRGQLSEKRYIPVFLQERKEKLFYSGFCKRILWPLFHTSPPTTEDTMDSHDFDYGQEENSEQTLWQEYISVNQTFADRIQEVYREGDLIWVQDYHFMLLPQMLRSRLPNAKIGIYFHLPFPSSELYRILPFREELLHGVINADLVGFQTYDYARHFLSTAEFLLGVECRHNGLEYDGFFTNVSICPIGIDPEKQREKTKMEEVLALIQRLEKQYESKTLFVSVDDLDNTQGLVHKLLALEELFRQEPALSDQISFIQVLNCKREGNPEKDTLQNQVQRLIARINSRVCRIDFEGPIQLRLNPPVEEITALYGLANVFVNTVIRDGMSVAPMEYIISRDAVGKFGRVILSEFAGSATSLGNGAWLVNPWDTTDLKDVFLKSLEPPEEEEKNHKDMVQYIESNTSALWGTRFIDQLGEANEEDQNSTSRRLYGDHLLSSLSGSHYRLFLFSLEGVLCQRVSMPELIQIKPEVMKCLNFLAEDPRNMVVIKSSRSGDALEKVMMKFNEGNPTKCVLAAEHGMIVKWGAESAWSSTTNSFIDNSWKADVLPLMEYYAERTPGSVIDIKDNSLTWYYMDCDAGHGSWLAKQLQVGLQEMGRRLPILVTTGDHCIEVTHIAAQVEVPNLVEVCLKQMISALSSRKRRASRVSSANLDEVETASESSGSFAKSESLENLRKEGSVSEKNSLELDILDTAVDFVFFVGTGMDFRDEDMYEYLAPNAIELDEFVKELNWVKPDGSADSDKAEENQPPLKDGKEKTLSRTNSSGALPLDTLKRQNNITSQQKFEPRKDFPPNAMIIKAMKEKYGNKYKLYDIPATAASCWALVLRHAVHPNARAIVDSRSPVEFLNDSDLAKGFAPIFPSTSDLPTLPEGKQLVQQEEIKQEKLGDGALLTVDPPLATFSCIIGPKVSQAMYMIKNKIEVQHILNGIVKGANDSAVSTGPEIRETHSLLSSNHSNDSSSLESSERMRLLYHTMK